MLDYCPKQGGEKQHKQTRRQRHCAQHNPRTSHKRTNNRRGTNHRATRRYNLVYSRLHDLVTKVSSKSHGALTRPLGSRFTGTSATCPDGLPRLTVPPRAFNVSGALPATSTLIDLFASRPIDAPHDAQRNARSDRGSLAFTTPHAEHVLLGEYHISTTRTTRSHHIHLSYFSPSTSRGTRTRTPNRAPAFEAGASTNSATLAKKGSGNKHEQQPRDHSAPNQRDTRTPATPPASPTRVRGHSQPAHPDRPNLLTNTESTLAQTPKRHPHTPSAPPMPPHTPSVTAPAAASIPVLLPLPGRRSRT